MDYKDWTQETKDLREVALRFNGWVDQCSKNMEGHHNRWLQHMKIVHGRGINSLDPSSYILGVDGLNEHKATKNLMRSAVAAMLSQTLRNQIRIYYLPRGGDAVVHERCRLLEQFVEGILESNHARDRLWHLVILDALVCGFGATRAYWTCPPGKNRADISLKRVLPYTIAYDSSECQDGDIPRMLAQSRLVSRAELLARFPKHKDHIRGLPTASSPVEGTATCRYDVGEPIGDRVLVREGWRLPSVPNASDGVYFLAVRDAILERSEWVFDHYPISFLEWFPAPLGYVAESLSLADEVSEPHSYVNELNEWIREQFRSAQSFIVNPQNSGVDNSDIDNTHRVKIISPPSPDLAPFKINDKPLDPQYLQHQRSEIQDAYEFSGISQNHIQGPAPKTHISNKAAQTQLREADARFKAWGERTAVFWRDLSNCIITQCRSAAAAGKSVESFVERFDHHDLIQWSKVDLESDQFTQQAKVISRGPSEVDGQIDLAQEVYNAGLMSKEDAIANFTDLPDLDAQRKVLLSKRYAVQHAVAAILRDGELRLPDRLDDSAYAEYYSTAVYVQQRYVLEKQPDGKRKKDMLLQYVEAARRLNEQAAAEAAAAQAQMMAPPQG